MSNFHRFLKLAHLLPDGFTHCDVYVWFKSAHILPTTNKIEYVNNPPQNVIDKFNQSSRNWIHCVMTDMRGNIVDYSWVGGGWSKDDKEEVNRLLKEAGYDKL